MTGSLARHTAKIARIAEQLRAHPRGTPVSLKKASVSHQVPKRGDLRHKDAKIDVADLTEILEIDPVKRSCTAEAGVTFVDLVTATMAHGLVPIVVPVEKSAGIWRSVRFCII